MSISIQIDEMLWRAAEKATEVHDPAELVRQLFEREIRSRTAQRNLAAMGGTMHDLEIPPRRRHSTEP